MPLARHGIAQDDRHPVGIEPPGRIAVILQRLVTGRDGPLLGFVDLLLDARRDGDAHFDGLKFESAHPTADLAVSFIEGGRVGVVKEVGFPAVVGYVGDGIAARLDVAPKCSRVGGIRQDGSNPDNGYGCCFTHAAPVSHRLSPFEYHSIYSGEPMT